MILPQSADYASGATVLLVDYPPALEASATAGADGVATVEFPAIDSQYLWRIERMTTYCAPAPAAGSAAAILVYEGPSMTPTRIRDGSASPGFDVADQHAPITLQPSSQLVVQWTDMPPGTVCSVSVQYQLWRRIIASGS